MEGDSVVVEQEQTEQEPSKDVDDSPSQGDDNEYDENEIFQSVSNNARNDETSEITEKSIVSWSTSNPDLLKMCKPISVKIIRLPDAAVNKFIAASNFKLKKKQIQYKWKSGFIGRHKRNKYLRRRRSQMLKAKAQVLMSLKLSVDGEAINHVGTSKLDEKSVLSTESTPVENNNESEDTEKLTKPCEPVADKEVPPELSTISSTVTEIRATTPCESDQTEIPKDVDGIEDSSATKILQSPISSPDDAKSSPKTSPLVITEQNNNLNSETITGRSSESDSTINPVEMRKRLYRSDDEEIEALQTHTPKKSKCSEIPDAPEIIYSTVETNPADSIETIPPMTENLRTIDETGSTRKFVRRRTKSTADNIYKESRVVLCKIEDSRDPFVLRWRMKMALQNLNEVVVNDCRTSNDDTPEAFDLGKELNDFSKNAVESLSEDDVAAATLDDESATPTAFESARNDSEIDEDDSEIVTFLRDRRKSRPAIYSSSSASSSQYDDASSNRSSPNGGSVGYSPYPDELSDCQEEEISRPQTATKRRPFTRQRIRSKSSSSAASDDNLLRDKIRRSPSTRRKAFQIAMHASCIDRFNTSDESNNEAEEETSNSIFGNECYERAEITNLNKNKAGRTEKTANGSDGRTSDCATVGQDRDDDATSDSLDKANREFSQIDDASSTNRDEDLEARRKLTELKNAMVVLTRLEDLDDISEDSRHHGSENEFTIAQDYEFPRTMSPTLDPLAINGDVNPNPNYEADYSIMPDYRNLPDRTSVKTPRRKAPGSRIGQGVAKSNLNTRLGAEDSHETAESDVEMTLLWEPTDSDAEASITSAHSNNLGTVAVDGVQTTDAETERIVQSMQLPTIVSVRSLAQDCPTDENSDGSEIMRNDENLGEYWKRGAVGCEKRETVKRPVERKTRLVKHTCTKCRSSFDDFESLSIHQKSSLLCAGNYHCTTCQMTFPTFAKLRRHLMSCATKEPQKETPVGESTNGVKTANPKNLLRAVRKKSSTNVEKNQASLKKHKKKSSKTHSKIDHLMCGVCTIVFPSTQALADHIFTHTTEELQKAYRDAKDKEDGASSSSVSESQIEKTKTRNAVAKKTTTNKSLPVRARVETSKEIQTRPAISVTDPLNAVRATVCACHRDEQPACPDKTDLQIEMVLYCRFCGVIFRRRECFEIHYRTNPQCATNRSRGRLPKLYCANCQVSLNSWAGMRRHLEIHASLNVEGTVRFVCMICRVIFVGFGTLFYNHWSNHLKDNMLVASSYSFPKSAVQSIEGVPKLPIGATQQETYILVAEHVCLVCQKPFSTRRDLEMHEGSGQCRSEVESTEKNKAEECKWTCNACNLTFPVRRGLNHHSKHRHEQRYICVATTPEFQTFMCTRCFTMMKTVKDIEDHWRHQPGHEGTLSQFPQLPFQNAARNQVTSVNSVDNERTNEMVIDISGDGQLGNDSQLVRKTHDSGGTTANMNNTTMNSLLEAVLTKDSANDQTTKIRALEDPCVNIVLSEISKENVSAKLVIERCQKNKATSSDDGKEIESYQIILSEKPSPGNIKMSLGRIGAESTTVKRPTATVTGTEANKQGPMVNDPPVTAVSSTQIAQPSTPTKSPRQHTVIRTPHSSRPTFTDEKENSKLARALTSKRGDFSVSLLQNSRPSFPEIIDIADEKEEFQGRPTANLGNACKLTPIVANNNAKPAACANSAAPKSKKMVAIINPSSKETSSVSSATPHHSHSYPLVLNPSEMSFEEIRLADMTRLKQLPTKDSAEAKKPGFLRVKNLSELQAVKTHTCNTCNAAFESDELLENHHKLRLCRLANKNSQFPKGMTAALVLPDKPDDSSDKQLQEVYAAGGVVAQQLIGLDSGIGVISSVPLPNMIVDNETTGSWIAVGNQNDSMSSIALVNSTHSFSGGTVLMNLSGQQSTSQSADGLMTTSLTSTSTISHAQGTFAVEQQLYHPRQQLQQQQLQRQQQLQQPHQVQQSQLQQQQPQQGPPTLSSNQHSGNNCSGQFGFHVMPSIAVPRQSQMDKQQCIEGPPRNSPTGNLSINGRMNSTNVPFTYNSDRPNRFICNICTTFSCNTVGAMNSHVMKHYTGFKHQGTNQNFTLPGAGTISNSLVIGQMDVPSQNVQMQCTDMQPNTPGNLMNNAMFMRHTPQGVVWVTSLTAMSGQRAALADGDLNRSSASPKTSQPDHPTNSNPTAMAGGQVVYRCLICKSAMYKAYQPLRNHVILVHGINDSASTGLENIVQKLYQCTYCAPGTVTYDSDENLRQHITACHSNACPMCGRTFVSPLSLKTHIGYCVINNGDSKTSHPNP